MKMKSAKGKLRASICLFLIITEIFFIIAAVMLHSEYGKGLGYYTLIILPLVSILIGMGSALRAKYKYWMLALVTFHLSVILYAYKSSNGDIVAFIPFYIMYVLLSIVTGFAFQR